MSKKTVLAVASVAALLAVAGTAVAGHIGGDVKSYTGCLSPNGGTLTQIKEGNEPLGACSKNQVEAHFSGGDITAIAAQTGGGLAGGGANGSVSLSLRRDCGAGQVLKWNGTGWACAADSSSTYTAGTGLDLNGSEFSIQPNYRVTNDQACTSGQFATGITGTGSLACAAPAAQGNQVWQQGSAERLLPSGEGVDLVILPLPAGTYLVTAVGEVSDAGGSSGDEEVTVKCWLRNGAFGSLSGDSHVDLGSSSGSEQGPTGAAVVHRTVTFASADSVRFTCRSSSGDSDLDEASGTVTALKIATVTTP